MSLIHSVKIINGFFPMMGDCRILIFSNLCRVEFGIYPECRYPISPTSYCYMFEILIINDISSNIFLCSGQTAMFVFHGFKSCYGNSTPVFSYRKTYFYEKIIEVIVILDDCFSKLFMIAFYSALFPTVEPIGDFGTIHPFFR